MFPGLKLRPKTWGLLALIAGLLALVFLLVRGLGLDRLPVFVDEAIYVRWAQVMRSEPTLRFLPQSDGKQPLYMWLVIPALKVISDPLVAGRMVSVVAGLGTMAGVGLLIFLVSQSAVWGIIAAAVYLVLPFAHFFDRMALADGLLSFFGVWSFVVGYLLVKWRRLDLAMILGFVLGGAVLTKSPGWLFLLLQPFLLLTSDIFTFSGKKKLSLKWLELGKILFFWAIAGAIAFGMYNILRLGPNFHMIAIRNRDYVFPFSELLQHPLNPLIGNLKDTFAWLNNLITWPALILALFSLLQRRRITLVLWLWILMPLIFQAAIAKAYTSRYFFYVIPFVCVLIALGLNWLWHKQRRVALVLAAAGLVLMLRYDWLLSTDPKSAPLPQNMANGYLQEWTAGWGQKEVASYLIERAKTKSVVVGTDGFFGTLPDGLQIYTEKVPNLTVIGVGVSFDKVPIQLEQALDENEVYFVVNQSRNNIAQTVLQERFELIASYPKQPRPDGSTEVLQFYRLLK